MHSSRMRTGRSLTVCWRLLPGGGVWSGPRGGWCLCLFFRGGVWSQGVPGPGGSALGGAWSWGCPSMHRGRSPLLWTESQTPVKTLPWPNFVAAGKDGKAQEKSIFCNIILNCHVAQKILQVLTPFLKLTLANPRGTLGMHPPTQSNSFYFHAVFSKIMAE